MAMLSDKEITEKLVSVPDLGNWQARISSADLVFADFVAAMSFVNRVAEEAEKANHHPDIDIRWNKVHLALSSHDAGGLTGRDFKLAAVIDTLV